ncbi:hypothetical protein OGH69_03505 [Flavobacterium sp. MFBS3-15]|uniref:hypothetical protein n=1 Tax=Flavobacterium sp. MFBS3-15 TaxID=2989816 RepID=UPI0022357A5B|nr:hypothetical protein [Flavobacterium sp. MFBS3-15]MCW4468020.1 hypothetical protein [Flavobacterium sp. MFBS3-15]
MITAEKIQVYDAFNGNWDGLALTGDTHQKNLFEASDDWYHLTNFYQDIVLINDKLASAEYAYDILAKMKEYCDEEGYKILTFKIVRL